jgi:diaminopimelate decarboxylase
LDVGDLLVSTTQVPTATPWDNYKRQAARGELLLRENGDVEMIRRPETIEDLFATLDWGKMAGFRT